MKGLPDDPRYIHVLTLDLSDPALSFLKLDAAESLPLLMNVADGFVSYSIVGENEVRLHTARGNQEPVFEISPMARRPLAAVPFTYEQYRAAALASAAFEDYLSSEDRRHLESLGETYSQIGGAHSLTGSFSPYCSNPDCLGYPENPDHVGIQGAVTDMLASIEKQLAPDVSFDYCPNDIAFVYSICAQCKSISGEVEHS